MYKFNFFRISKSQFSTLTNQNSSFYEPTSTSSSLPKEKENQIKE